MNETVVLDTNAYSHLFRGDEAVLDVISRAKRVLLPVTVLGELFAGFRIGNREGRNRRDLEDFLSRPSVRVLTTTPEVADLYGVIVSDLRAAGDKIPTNDLWIAAHTLSVGGVLVTYDRHFEKVPGLRRWPGPGDT
ncbi:type II toxin-antitoxin system VapC family toxin [Haloferula sp. A504]|uniref:type II toxin-antitoxin system VapC family toxin n=1 Tax=Haloferula sp. A504 TaxID=3373601 RepID=UPI0031C0A7F2|nr:type II toxin-antitoxin system VapC family toxin [Verrucomicrobiaceae bacterium E54]